MPQLLARGNGADEQLRVYDEDPDLSEVTRWLGEQTAPHPR